MICSILHTHHARVYYETDDQFLKRYEEFQTFSISESKLEGRSGNTARFPFVLKLNNSGVRSGHSILLNAYGPGRYSLIDENHGLLFSSRQEIQNHMNNRIFGHPEMERTNKPRYDNQNKVNPFS